MQTIEVKNRSAWRSWLTKNAAKCDEVWLVHYKKAVSESGISYEDSVEEVFASVGSMAKSKNSTSFGTREDSPGDSPTAGGLLRTFAAWNG